MSYRVGEGDPLWCGSISTTIRALGADLGVVDAADTAMTNYLARVVVRARRFARDQMSAERADETVRAWALVCEIADSDPWHEVVMRLDMDRPGKPTTLVCRFCGVPKQSAAHPIEHCVWAQARTIVGGEQ